MKESKKQQATKKPAVETTTHSRATKQNKFPKDNISWEIQEMFRAAASGQRAWMNYLIRESEGDK